MCSTVAVPSERPDAIVSKVLVQAALIPAVLALIVAAVLAIEVNSLVTLSRWVQHTDEVIGSAREIQAMLVDRESALRGYVIARSAEYLEPYEIANSALPGRWEALLRLVSDNPTQMKRVADMRQLAIQWEAFARAAIAANPRDAATLVATGQGRSLMQQLRNQLEDFVRVEEGLRDERARKEERGALRAVAVCVGLLVAVAVLMAFSARRQIREVARRFGAALHSAQEVEKLRDEFITIAAHELRTPLTALLLQLQRLRRDLDRGTALESSALIDTPLRQARRLSSLIESLLDAQAVASGGHVELRLSRTDLATIAQASLARVRDGLVHLGCQVEMRLDAGVDGDWDAPRIEHIAATLIANACKYGEGKPVQVSARREGEVRILTVTDEGIGIPDDVQERIFGRFGRAAPSRSYGGFGLSLFVARRLAEAHGGTLTVTSEHGKGAIFTLRLPRVAAPGEPEEGFEARRAG
jgi:signal transduction histidine kinase